MLVATGEIAAETRSQQAFASSHYFLCNSATDSHVWRNICGEIASVALAFGFGLTGAIWCRKECGGILAAVVGFIGPTTAVVCMIQLRIPGGDRAAEEVSYLRPALFCVLLLL